MPCPMHMIVDHALLSSGPLYDKEPGSGWNTMVTRYDWSDDNRTELAKGWIKQAGSITELATAVGLDASRLEETVSR